MRIIKVKNYEELSARAAGMIAAQVNIKPQAILGLATGGSPVGVYARLVEMFHRGEVDFSEAATINLDEYRGLSREHIQSYRSFMRENLFNHINVKEENIHIPDGENLNSEAVCREYDEVIRRLGGIDLQLLGMGLNGHIGFNEPGDVFEPDTHCVNLAESTIEANKRFFNSKDEVPKQAYTMGIRPIMQAKKVLMIANGKDKADIMKQAFTGKVTPKIPASVLQLHPDFTLIADEAALSAFEW